MPREVGERRGAGWVLLQASGRSELCARKNMTSPLPVGALCAAKTPGRRLHKEEHRAHPALSLLLQLHEVLSPSKGL